ncbi:MAG: GGDEF domain-containing protein [Patulibacter minatonensis]
MGHLAQFLPRSHTDPSDLSLMRKVAATMCLGGALSSFGGAFTVQTTTAGQDSQLVLASALVVLGLAIALLRSSYALFRGGVLASVGIISAMMATAQPISTTEFFYLWPVVFAGYFLGRRWFAITLVWLAGTLLVALSITTDAIVKGDVLTSTLMCVGIIGALVTIMREREERLRGGLEIAARTDALTGLLNRHGLEPELARLVDGVRITGIPLAVALFDLDHFKWFNDAHGHLEGDEALRRIGHILRASARAGDCVVRFGGEEFAVLLPGATAQGAHNYAERVAEALSAEDITDELRLSASCGIAHLARGDSIDAVFGRADEALYAAKNSGRNRAAWWNSDGEIVVGQPLETLARRLRSVPPTHPREYVLRLADRRDLRADGERRTA